MKPAGIRKRLAVIMAAVLLPFLACDGIPAAEAAEHDAMVSGSGDAFVRFESGEAQIFANAVEAKAFLEEYLLQYRMLDIRSNRYWIVHYSDCVTLPFPKDGGYDRDGLTEGILERFGSLKGSTRLEKIRDMCRRINGKMEYDTELADITMTQALETGRGVCWHYVKIGAALLQESGVPATVAHGLLDGDSHVWLQCRLEDGTIINVDPEEGILDTEHMKHLTPAEYIPR